ncbi:hypothetical protein D3C86_2033340 [compost metagenome]
MHGVHAGGLQQLVGHHPVLIGNVCVLVDLRFQRLQGGPRRLDQIGHIDNGKPAGVGHRRNKKGCRDRGLDEPLVHWNFP